MAVNNRELSQFGSFIRINDPTKAIGITTEATPFVGIGTDSPESKLTVIGDTNISGVVTATAFYGDGSTLSNILAIAVDGWVVTPTGITTTTSVGIGTTDQPLFTLDVDGDINFTGTLYEDGSPFVASRWTSGTGDDIYRLNGDIGIGTDNPTSKLHVVGNTLVEGDSQVDGISTSSRFVSTVASGTSPLTVSSTTLVTNLNADLFRGRVPPTGDFVGTSDDQTLTNKILTSPTVNGIGVSFAGSSSGYTRLSASATASGILTLPAETGTLISSAGNGVVTSGMIANNTIVNTDINSSAGITYSKLSLSNSIVNADINSSASIAYSKLNLSSSIVNADIASGASIAISKLAASTISGISLGSNLATLTFGTYLTGTSYNGSAARTIGLNASTSGTSNIVARDSSGNFSAGTITATLNGNASTATSASSADQIKTIATATASNHFITFVNSNNGSSTSETLYTDAGIFYNPSSNNMVVSGTLTVGSIVKSGGTSSQFLKADGSVDSNSYTTTGKAIAMAMVFS